MKIKLKILISTLLISLFMVGCIPKIEPVKIDSNDVSVVENVNKNTDDKNITESSNEEDAEKSKDNSQQVSESNSSLNESNDDKEKTNTQGSTNADKYESESNSQESTNETNKKKYVTMSITCNTILNNLDKVEEGKKSIIPSNGVIYAEKKIEISEGESVYDVLLRETRNNRIHMDFVMTPAFNSAYIKGIANIYEFDAGDLSGWMYSVNGVFPDFGCSLYKLKNEDKIEWKYTCDLGRDLGKSF